jgi:hypothetical protein
MIKFSLIIAVSFVLFYPFYSQAQLAVLRDNGTGNPIITNPYKEVKGSAYVEEFKIGTLLLSNGQKVEELMIALNGYDNTLEYKLSGDLFAYSPEKLAGFTFTSESGELVEYTSDYVIPTLSKRRFLKVLEKGKYTLLQHQYKIMVDDVSATYGAQGAKVFQAQEDFFIVKDDKVFLFKNKSKDMQQIFGEDFGKVNSIVKEQKLNLKDLSDLQELIRQLN